jgi:2-oxoglutarate dehydrogenase E2 component (dihydrolipoamide succinyltransferase)
MAQVEIVMPKMGESVFEATVTKWLKKEGDKVAIDESIVEIATDKVDSEIPSTAEGILVKYLIPEGEIVQVGKAVAIIATAGNDNLEVPKANVTPVSEPLVNTHQPIAPATPSSVKEVKASGTKFLSPLVKTIARQEGVTVEELETIAGTGAGGRITKKDILDFLPNKNKNENKNANEDKGNNTSFDRPVTTQPHKPAVSINGGDEIVEMDRMRKLISEHMIMSKQISAHVTSFVEADVTNVVLWRDKMKDTFEAQEKEKLTFTPIFIEVIAKAIREFPMINISVNGDKIIKHKNINIGMAAALPSGNLIVPVIKNADTLSLIGLTKKVNDLANRARTGHLLPDEVQGGTYTLTNVGTFGNIMGTPIISQPQVAIMAVGIIKKKPAVIETASGDTIGIRHFMYLSHSYDHRVIDGSLGGQFVKRVADLLEQWDINRTI